MPNISYFIARRIHGSGDKKRVSQPAVLIATLGVAVGLAVMIVSVCVILGFKHTVRDKIVGFGSHIIVTNYLNANDYDDFPIVMGDSMITKLKAIDGVRHVQRYAFKQGILKTDKDFLGVVFKGVGPEYDTTFIASNVVSGQLPHFSDTISTNRIAISQYMADKLRLKCGDRILAYFIKNDDVRMRKLTVAAVYQTYFSRYDEAVVFTDLYTVRRLNGWEEDQASGAELTINDFDDLGNMRYTVAAIVNQSQDRNGDPYISHTVKERNQQTFSWLDLLDLNVWIILALMICVSGFTMISGLLIIILERTQMIGILKALGARNNMIRRTFIWLATFILVRGLLIGNILGIGLVVLQHYTGLVKLDAETYYVSVVPVELNIPVIVLLNVATMIVSILVLIGPSYLISHIHPVKAIRFE
ncbi:MAG: ABC transporter permease [Prevotella sp.]|nr:ABC transporter permease [Prevotella sp.]MCR5151697.1 ABC transporter permease [Prevotella sp.]